ncbi:MAG: polyribonucleotide nucleotidyltransferase [Phycisphaerales bacterium JB060]
MPTKLAPRSARPLIVAALTTGLLSATVLQAACGTILYPERRGQDAKGDLDIGVVLLDGVGLLFFLIPGIIAYAIDFSTGAIYLPPDEEGLIDTDSSSRAPDLQIPTNELTAERLAAELSEKTGKDVSEADVLAAYPQLRTVGE